MLWGEPKIGKSALALSVAYQMAAGRGVVHGHSAEAQRVLYVVAEGQQDFRGRLMVLKARFGHASDFRCRDQAIDLRDADSADTKALIDDLRQQGTTLLVLDTVSRMLGAADENSSRDMGGFIRTLSRIIAETGVAVLAIHHGRKAQSGDAEGLRGHGSLRAAADTVVRVTKLPGDTRIASVNESRAAAGGPWIAFRLCAQPINLEEDNATACSVIVADIPWSDVPESSLPRSDAGQNGRRGKGRDGQKEARFNTIHAAVIRVVQEEGLSPPESRNLPAGTMGVTIDTINAALDRLCPGATNVNKRKRRQLALGALENAQAIVRDHDAGMIWLVPS